MTKRGALYSDRVCLPSVSPFLIKIPNLAKASAIRVLIKVKRTNLFLSRPPCLFAVVCFFFHSILVPDLVKHVEWLSSLNYKISTSLRYIWSICKNSYPVLFKGPSLFKPHNNALHVRCCIKTRRTMCVVILSYAVHMRQAYCWKWTVSSGTRQPQILTLHMDVKIVNEKSYHPPESTGNIFPVQPPLRAINGTSRLRYMYQQKSYVYFKQD